MDESQIDPKQRAILDAAIVAFNRKGISATVTEISKIANIPEATVYRLVQSKEHIVLLIFEEFWQKLNGEIENTRDSNLDKDALGTIRRIMYQLVRYFFQKPQLIRTIATHPLPLPEEFTDASLKAKRLKIRDQNRQVLRLIDGIIRQGQEDGSIVNNLKPQVIRQILIGGFMLLFYGVFLQFNQEEDVGYSATDANEGMDFLLGQFSSVKTATQSHGEGGDDHSET